MPGAVVGDGQQDVVARLHVDVMHGVLGVEVDVRRFDRQAAARYHGVARVDGQVDDDLLDLSRIEADGGEVLRADRREHDVFADQARDHLFHAMNDIVQIEHLRARSPLCERTPAIAASSAAADCAALAASASGRAARMIRREDPPGSAPCRPR